MYIAEKPCHFKGEFFPVGKKIPDGMFDKSKVSALVKWGMITEVDGEEPKAEKIADYVKSAIVDEVKAFDAAQPVQNAPEATGEVETVETATEEEKPVKKGRKGGRKKAEA